MKLVENQPLMAMLEELQKKEVHYSQLSWVQYTVGYDLGVTAAEEAMYAILENKDYFEMVSAAYDQCKVDGTEDDLRRAQLLFKRFEPFHLSAEVNAKMRAINEKVTLLSQVLNWLKYLQKKKIETDARALIWQETKLIQR